MLIGRHSFIRQSKLSDVTGRIDYISNPKRQEYLYFEEEQQVERITVTAPIKASTDRILYTHIVILTSVRNTFGKGRTSWVF